MNNGTVTIYFIDGTWQECLDVKDVIFYDKVGFVQIQYDKGKKGVFWKLAAIDHIEWTEDK